MHVLCLFVLFPTERFIKLCGGFALTRNDTVHPMTMVNGERSEGRWVTRKGLILYKIFDLPYIDNKCNSGCVDANMHPWEKLQKNCAYTMENKNTTHELTMSNELYS